MSLTAVPTHRGSPVCKKLGGNHDLRHEQAAATTSLLLFQQTVPVCNISKYNNSYASVLHPQARRPPTELKSHSHGRSVPCDPNSWRQRSSTTAFSHLFVNEVPIDGTYGLVAVTLPTWRKRKTQICLPLFFLVIYKFCSLG